MPLTSATYWEVALDAVSVHGEDVTSPNRRAAIVDSGTSLLAGPAESVAAATANCSTCYENFEGEREGGLGGFVRSLVWLGAEERLCASFLKSCDKSRGEAGSQACGRHIINGLSLSLSLCVVINICLVYKKVRFC